MGAKAGRMLGLCNVSDEREGRVRKSGRIAEFRKNRKKPYGVGSPSSSRPSRVWSSGHSNGSSSSSSDHCSRKDEPRVGQTLHTGGSVA